jgi:hypothetical protein
MRMPSLKRAVQQRDTLARFADDLAMVLPTVDARTSGQYGDGLGSEDESEQLAALLAELRVADESYDDVQREVPYPDRESVCDIQLPDGTPVEAKLLRYWRANGDPEPGMYTHVFSPFHSNTLLTDARRLAASEFSVSGGLLGLFYARDADDSTTVEGLPERFRAPDIAQKVAEDIDYWYDLECTIARIASVDGLQHSVHRRAAVIAWCLE